MKLTPGKLSGLKRVSTDRGIIASGCYGPEGVFAEGFG